MNIIIMMDPTKTYLKGFLVERPFIKADCSYPSRTRTACWYRYCSIDFGRARWYDPADGIPNEWILWDFYKLTRTGLDFLRPLVEDMVKDNSSEQPTIDDVVVRFDELRKSHSRWRLQAVTQLGIGSAVIVSFRLSILLDT